MGPMEYGPGEAVGAPDHPHRGGSLTPGDVQWMTAGEGIVHREMPSEEIVENGGRVHGFQVWVNLPKKHKMMKPRYQERKAANIPKAVSEDGKARVTVIAGSALGDEASIETVTPIIYHHCS